MFSSFLIFRDGAVLVIAISIYTIGLDSILLYRFSQSLIVFTAQGYAKRGICRRRVSVCVSVCLCVCLSHSGIVSKRLNTGSRKQRRTIAP